MWRVVCAICAICAIFMIFVLGFGVSLQGKSVLNIGVSNAVGPLNPQGYGQNEMFGQNMIYEGLVKINKKGEIIPSLATSWDIKDSRIYTFNLRKNVKFSNGEDFNAMAVKKNFDSILKNKARHSWARLSMLIDNVRILDEYKIEITLKAPYTATLNELSLIRPFRFIAPSEIPANLDLVRHNPKPIGTGAYIYSGNKRGISDSFTKNENYWDKASHKGNFDTIIMRHILDSTAKVIALKSGQIDMIYGLDNIPIEIFNEFKESKDFNTFASPPVSTIFLALNPKNIESNLRAAIIHSIDRDSLSKAVFYDSKNMATSLFYDKYTWGNADFKPQTAKQILESSGYKMEADGYYYKDSKKVELTLMYEGDNALQKSMSEIIQNNLKSIGISLKIQAKEPSIYKNLQGSANFDMCYSITWGVPYEPLIMLNSMKAGGHVFSIHKYLPNNEALNNAIDKALELDSNTAIINALEIINKTNIYLPLQYETNKAITKKDIKGVEMGVYVFEIPFWEFYR